jgi:hypothetical protein
VCSDEKGDTTIVFARAEVEGTGALVVGRLERGDGEAERGRERLAEFGDGVDEGVEERSFGPPTDRLTSDSRKATSILGKPAQRRIPLITSAAATAASKRRDLCLTLTHMSSGQNGIFSPVLAKATGSIEVQLTPQGEERVDLGADLEPGGCDRMAINRARSADEALRLRTPAFGPGTARLVDAGSTAGHTVEVLVGGRIVVGER